ncbi:hypothetical protein BU16DRAFT_857 [Lophium mytilinum]|uniref:Uncharacterized protein n=1 Tax=Lophium mytilinum TaxID=390894 RepID=A0A6A6RF27_9PEZI|nr:hypothetical protein BU16DRAFT_857 [Lophium mytilinum]
MPYQQFLFLSYGLISDPHAGMLTLFFNSQSCSATSWKSTDLSISLQLPHLRRKVGGASFDLLCLRPCRVSFHLLRPARSHPIFGKPAFLISSQAWCSSTFCSSILLLGKCSRYNFQILEVFADPRVSRDSKWSSLESPMLTAMPSQLSYASQVQRTLLSSCFQVWRHSSLASRFINPPSLSMSFEVLFYASSSRLNR